MKIIVVTYPEPVINEGQLLNRLFENGLECLHIRKPELGIKEMEKLLGEVETQYHSRISLHQHHELNEKFCIGGIHYTEEKRKRIEEKLLIGYKSAGFTLSTSVHSFEEYQKLSGVFDYCFFGPVFDSISKKNYHTVIKDDFRVSKNNNVELIAIGGINEDNLFKSEKMGFSGVALLGAVWMNENPVEKYLQIKKVCQKKQYMY